MKLGTRLAERRKELGMTQIELADAMHVTRQTVSRWEAETALPDIEKLSQLASILNVSCDYLLQEDAAVQEVEAPAPASAVTRLLQGLVGKRVKLSFFDECGDIDLFDKECQVLSFDHNWVRVEVQTKKATLQKLLPLSSIDVIELVEAE